MIYTIIPIKCFDCGCREFTIYTTSPEWDANRITMIICTACKAMQYRKKETDTDDSN